MATRIQFRRGTTSQHASFTGSVGEMTVDTDKECVVVHDGSTAGGFPMARADANNMGTNVITATHLNVSGNGTAGDALLSDGDGSFSWGNGGAIVRMESYRFTSNFTQSISTSGFTNVSSFNPQITPQSASNKIWFHIQMQAHNNGNHLAFQLKANGSTITDAIGDSVGSRSRASFKWVTGLDNNHASHLSFSYLHSPNSTSLQSYTLACGGEQGTLYFNRTNSWPNSSLMYGATVPCIVYMLEVAG